MRPLPRHQPSHAQQQIQATLREHVAWIARLCPKYGLPRAALLKMLDRPGALEDEIAAFIVEKATEHAQVLFQDDAEAPDGDDLYTRAVRGVHAGLVARKAAADEAERIRQFKETDELLRRMKAGEDV